MSKRILSLAGCVCLATIVASGQSSYVFQDAGANGSTTQVVGLGDNDFSRFLSNPTALAGVFQVIATPAGTKFFFVSPLGVQAAPANSSLSPLTTLTGISGTVTSAGITPDGKYLLVMADHFYVINATSNAVVQIDVGVTSNGSPVSFAVSHDARTVWVLSTDNNGGGALASVDLTSFQVSVPSSLSNINKGSSVTVSPLGLLYVTSTGDLLYEVDPVTLAKTSAGNIQIPSGLFGPLHFTPDGTTAYSVNRNAPICSSCVSLLMLTVATHSVLGWPSVPDPNNPPQLFDDVFVAGNSQVYAFASSGLLAKLFDVTSAPFAAVPSALGAFPNGPGLPINNVLAVAVSNERPTARFLYLMISNGDLLRVSVPASNLDTRASFDLSKGTALSFAPIPAQSGAANIVTLNRTPNLAAGATSTPLVGEVVDSLGRPVMGVSVCFAVASSDLVINNPSQVTNADGWVQTTVTASASATGPYQIALNVGAACPTTGNLTATFTVTVGGGTTTTGNSQISIYTGNGQLLRQQNSTTQTQPLTVKITNTDGTPLAGAQVTWAVTQGPGRVSPIDSASDDNGLFRANFLTDLVDQSHAFVASDVNASSVYGSVDFTETTQNANIGDPGQPGVAIIDPQNQQFSIAQGDVVPNGVVAKTTSGHFPQSGVVIPNIGIRLADPDITDQSAVLSCQGPTLGGDDGISHCKIIAACQPPGTFLPQTFQVVASVGEYAFYPLLVTVTPGKASLLSVVSGNNQTGSPGTSFTLLAKVTDGCNQSVNGLTVSWTVTQGSASLTQVQTVSSNNGTVSARVTLGSTPGPVQVLVSGAGLAPVVFSLTTQVAVSGVSLVSGGGQSAAVGQAFANPVVFAVRDTNGNPVQGLLVNFSLSGSATFNPTSATTNAHGQVQTSVTAGATAGTITVTATYSTLTASATLSSHPPGPVVDISSFKNAASGAVGMVPCGLVTVTGSGLAPTPGVFSGLNAFGPLPYTLGPDNVSITANNVPVPLQVVANQGGVQQVNFQAPCELTPGTATVVISVNGASTTVNGVAVLPVQPGIFTYAGPNGKLYGAVIREADGSYVTPSNLAHQGQKYYMVVTGLNQTTPAIVTNSAGTIGVQNVNLLVEVGVHDNGVPVLSARYLFGSVGAYLVEFQIPANAPLGTDQSLAVVAFINGTTPVFGNSVFLPGVAP